ncbi:MAG TPA: ELWxxDGT repeat protein, partial [Thermoanaerobaculia bacterium]|nr:ELWxxDGT repeat protein [Thermoanaerobaculia bacterium]
MIHKRWLFLLALLLAPAAVPAQPAFQVADLNTTQPRASSGFGLMLPLATVGTKIFFQGDDGIHGVELWWVDSATGATAMVKDICPGECPSGASDVTLSNGILYFWAYEGVHGYEPWRSDGTVAGTFLLQDVYPGGLFSIVSGTPFVDVDGTLFFAADDGVHGAELWKVNASGTGAELVADIVPGPERSTPHPWLSKDGELIFTANDGAHGRELWKSDGTAAGTQMIRDLHPGDLSSVPDPFSIVRFHYALPDGTFVFGADDGVHGSELWRSDGTDAGTVLVEDIASGADSSSPFNFVPMNGTIVFAASTPSLGREIWGTNGTEAGTSLFIDATPGPSDSSPRDLTVAGNQIFFFSGLGASNIGRPLYRADASQGKVLIASEVRVASSLGSSLLFLTGAVGIGQPLQLWKTEGTPAGNVLLKDFGAQVQFCFQNIDPRALSGAVYFHTCPSDTG